MTVPSTKNVKTHSGNGTTTEFPFDFRIFDASDLEVTLTLEDGTVESLMQSRLSIGSLESPVTATPSGMAAILGDRLESAQDHLAALGLEPVPLEEPVA